MITFEPRENYARLGSSDVQVMADEVSELAQLYAFLQQKADAFTRAQRPASDSMATA